MGKKKPTDIRIKVAMIGAAAVVIAALFGSPFFDSLYKDRPIIDISFRGLETELPFKELPSDAGGYFLEFVSRNRGNDDGKIIVIYNPSLEVIKKQLNFNKEIDSSPDIGYSLIYHNTDYSQKEVVKKYYEKEIIERAFKQMKGILNLRPIRVWLKDHVEGHIKICYLAYAILSLNLPT